MEPSILGEVLRFGAFELDVKGGVLRKSGVRLKLRPQAFRVLALLARRSGELVTREEIQGEIWADDLVVDFDQGLNFCVRQIRSALADNAETPRFIETVPRRGYRFLVPVERLAAVNGRSAAENSVPDPDPKSEAKREARGRIAWMVGAAGLAAAIGAWAVLGSARSVGSVANAPVRSLAVLPLANLSNDASQDFFADGMTEALIDQLSVLSDVRVVSRTSVMQFKGAQKAAPAIASDLNVEALVEGAVLFSAERVRISVRLIRAGVDKTVWSNSYERDMKDVLSLQRELAGDIARQIEGRLDQGLEAKALRKVDPAALRSYLQGRFQLNRGVPESAKDSIRHFEAAIAIDPAFAQAHSGLGRAYMITSSTSRGEVPGSEGQPKALAAARRALELDPNLPEAHTIAALALEQDWEWAQAEAEFRRALELDPNDSEALLGLGSMFVAQMRIEEGLVLAQRAREMDPLILGHTAHIGWLLYQARRYDEAIRELRTALAIDPKHRASRWYLGFALIEKRSFDEAIRILEQAAADFRRNPAELGVLARAYALAGRRADALRIVDELRRQQRAGFVPSAAFVNAYAALDADQAFASIDRAVREHSNMLHFLHTHPVFDPIRSDPRFGEVRTRVRL